MVISLFISYVVVNIASSQCYSGISLYSRGYQIVFMSRDAYECYLSMWFINPFVLDSSLLPVLIKGVKWIDRNDWKVKLVPIGTIY